MKISTWNVGRPSSSSIMRNSRILDSLRDVDADILILTETNSCIHPGEKYSHSLSTNPLIEYRSRKGETYKDGENRVTIWSKYPATRSLETYDPFSSICVCLSTPLGELNVYGTVIGSYGNRDKGFTEDLEMQVADWQRLSGIGNLCIAGDFNISFADNFYYTKIGRRELNDRLCDLKINVLTRKIKNNIDHIAISEASLGSVACKTGGWNTDRDKKMLSDHMGVWLMLERS